MQNLVIDKKGCRLSAERKLFVIHHSSLAKPIQIPFTQIQSITITTQADLSSQLLTRLAEHNISVCVLPSARSGEACFLLGSWHAATRRREIQYAIVSCDLAKSYWAAKLIRLKLQRQANTLIAMQRIALSDAACLSESQREALKQVPTTVRQLKGLRDKLCKMPLNAQSTLTTSLTTQAFDYTNHSKMPIASILGTEGIGSALYFNCYQGFFAAQWQFDHRNKRPPKDPVNVVLSLSYTLLQHIYQQALYSVGFDPYRGVLHSPSYGRQSLACDFVELQRGAVELWVWQLFHDGILSGDDFAQSNERYPCELLKSGRAKYYQAFSALRTKLSKDALHHVWIWQRRLKHYHPNDQMTNNTRSLVFVSELPEHLGDL